MFSVPAVAGPDGSGISVPLPRRGMSLLTILACWHEAICRVPAKGEGGRPPQTCGFKSAVSDELLKSGAEALLSFLETETLKFPRCF